MWLERPFPYDQEKLARYVSNFSHICGRDILIYGVQYKLEVQEASFLYYIIDKGCYKKTANAKPKLVKFLNTEFEVKEFADKILETQGFPQFVGTMDDTHIEIVEPKKRYSDYIKRNG